MSISTLAPTFLSDSIALDDQGDYSVSSSFARLVLSTTATTLRLSTYNNSVSSFASLTKFGVWVDGAYLASFAPASNGHHDFYLGLGSGSKEIEFVAGVQSKPSSLLGCYLVSVTANAPLTQVQTVADDRALIYGDSISVGDGTGSTNQVDAWAMQARSGFDGSVALEAWGYRSLKQDYDSDNTFAELVARFVEINPTVVWLSIGTNDYGLNKWAAASFGSAYAILLDAIHSALPLAAIYAQTPTVRTSEVANGSGSTLGDYRTQIISACSSRAWATSIDGSSIITTDDLDDAVHPNVTGHGKIAAAFLAEFE